MNDLALQRHKQSVERARSGDREAFSALVNSHYARVWRFLLKWVHNPSDAEELAQETFLAAWQRIGGFRGDSQFSTWLLGIALNLARNHRNRSPAMKEVELPEESLLENLLASGADPADLVADKATLIALEKALGELSGDLREVILLVRLDGLSLEEVSVLLGIPVGTVKSRLFRARDKLAGALAAHLV